jgi:hypothetical protein
LDAVLCKAVTIRQAPSRKRHLSHWRSGQDLELVDIDHTVIGDFQMRDYRQRKEGQL